MISLSYHQGIQTDFTLNLFYIFLLLCLDYNVADLTKPLELHLTVVSVLLKIRFGHTQISVPKISIYTDVKNSLYSV